MSGCSRWNFTDGLPETSNCYCHPGIAGGSPAYASRAKRAFSASISLKSTLEQDGMIFLWQENIETRIYGMEYLREGIV